MNLFDLIVEWFREMLITGIISNINGMFDEVNAKVGDIAVQVGQTPQGFNASVFNMIKNLSDTVIIPIAGMILTFVLCYELIQMIIEKNNMHDFETFILYKWVFKTFVAVFILTHTFDIVMGVFALAQNVIDGSAGVITGSIDIDMIITDLEATLEAMEVGELLGLYIESMIIGLGMKALSLCIFIIIYGRMVETYLAISVAPIPFSTMVNREWGQMGNNYLKALFALAFQGFLIMVCVGIYSVLLNGITASSNIHLAILECGGMTLLLVFTLFKTGSFAKSVFNSH